MSFGSYTLWSLGWALFTFRDCPEAYQELLSVRGCLYMALLSSLIYHAVYYQEITTAKNELRIHGVSVD